MVRRVAAVSAVEPPPPSPPPPPPATLSGVLYETATAALEQIDSERGLRAIASHDEEPADVVPLHRFQWITPLADFLGDEEPDDDDSADWIIRDIIPRGEPCLLAGPPKSGKTWIAGDLGLCVAAGLPWVGFENTLREPARVLAILLEDSERRLRKRIWQLARGHGIDPRTLAETLSITRKPFGMPDRKTMGALTSELKAWKPRLVLVDNLTRVMAGDPNATKEAAEFGRAWMLLCQDAEASVGFLHHTSKAGPEGKKRSPQDRVRGSGDFVATARNVMVIDPLSDEDTDDKRSAIDVFGNLDLRRESFVLGYESTLAEDGRRLVRLVDLGDAKEVRAEVREQRKERKAVERKERRAAQADERADERAAMALHLALTRGSVSVSVLKEELGCSPSTASATLKHLRELGQLSSGGQDGHTITDAGRAQALKNRGVQ